MFQHRRLYMKAYYSKRLNKYQILIYDIISRVSYASDIVLVTYVIIFASSNFYYALIIVRKKD